MLFKQVRVCQKPRIFRYNRFNVWGWCLLWVCLAWSGLEQEPLALAESYQCTGRLRRTRARRISCRKTSWQSCRAGSVIYHPGCALACRQKCKTLRAKQRKSCQGEVKRAPLCSRLAKRWRQRCAEISRKAQQICHRKADVLPCRDTFHQWRKDCTTKQKTYSKRCRVTHKRRLRSCSRLKRALRLRQERICKRAFERCRKRCVPMRWPCRKRCFFRRHRCVKIGRRKVSLCRQVAMRLLGECEIKADQKQTLCTQKGENKMYACMRRLRRKRIVCMIGVGKRYTQCIQKSGDIQLQCWFRKMGREYLCSGTALQDCQNDLRQTVPRCLRQCPRCRVSTAMP